MATHGHAAPEYVVIGIPVNNEATFGIVQKVVRVAMVARVEDWDGVAREGGERGREARQMAARVAVATLEAGPRVVAARLLLIEDGQAQSQ